jgi:DNA polymerase elongation subunit (family B)
VKTGDEYNIRGFEYRRSNVSRLGRELQYDVLTSILEGEDQKEIIRMVEAAEKTIKQGEDLDNIGIPQTISMPLSLYKSIQPHVRAAMYTNDHLEPQKQIGALDKILMFYIKGCPSDKPKTDVIALDFGAQLPSGYILDDKMHIEKIHKLIEPIYEAVGWKMVSSAQQTLSTF